MDNVNYLIVNPMYEHLFGLQTQNDFENNIIKKKFNNKMEQIKSIIRYLGYLDDLLKNK